jgi:hypothetical protein
VYTLQVRGSFADGKTRENWRLDLIDLLQRKDLGGLLIAEFGD